jgi:hypothetical protein
LPDRTVVKIPIQDPEVRISRSIDFSVSDSEYHLAPTSRTEECGFQLTGLKIGDKGVIQTPGHPKNYPPNIKCIWWLKVLK